MYDFNLIPQITAIFAIGSLVSVILFYIITTKRFSLGLFLTTILPMGIGAYAFLSFRFDYIQTPVFLLLGLLATILGAILSLIANHFLGKNSDDFWVARKRTAHRYFVSNGPYRYIRHPVAVSLILFYGGLTVVFFHPFSFFFFILALIITISTSFAEERFMMKLFPEYGEYMKRTGRFFPRLLKVR
jgi:protein-S-isoprenylcysteine O-methyltransferase Ste14